MLELTGWGEVLRTVGTVYWVIAFGSLGLVIYKSRGKRGLARWLPIGLVLLVFFALPIARFTVRVTEGYQRKVRLDKAMARFEELCKGSGEFINRTVDDVEGVFIENYAIYKILDTGQYSRNDFYGGGCSHKDCISNLIIDTRMIRSERHPGSYTANAQRLYYYIEIMAPETGKLYRFTKESKDQPLTSVEISQPTARYSIEWSDISRKEDRDYWIAGGALRIFDLSTGELVAERRGYRIDTGQGYRGTGRSPWGWARLHGPECPSVSKHNIDFIKKILKPTSGATGNER